MNFTPEEGGLRSFTMEYFFWSNIVVWVSLAGYALYLREKSLSIRRKLSGLGDGKSSRGAED